MTEKFENYYQLVDVFNNDMSKFKCFDESSPGEEILFKSLTPIAIEILMRYLKPIINDICTELGSKEKVQKEIEEIKHLISNKSDNKIKEYKWKGVTIIDLLKGDYSFLKKKFILEHELVPSIDYYINDYKYPSIECSYPFSLKELYKVLIERGINILIDNYYSDNK